MKKIFSLYSILCLTGLLLFVSCEDEDLIRYPNIEKSIAMKLTLDPNFAIFDALDIPNAKIAFSLFTEGDNLAESRLYLDYFNFTQDSIYDRVLLETWSRSDFGSDGFIENYDLTAQAIADALGINIADMDGGDRFDFVLFHNDTDGNLFPDSIPTVVQGDDEFFNMIPGDLASVTTSISTQFTTFIACPVPAGYATGNYAFLQSAGLQDPFFGTGLGILNIEPDSDGNMEGVVSAPDLINRTITVRYTTFAGRAFNFILVCNNIIVPFTGASAGCSGSLAWAGGPTIGTYSDDDDSQLVIPFLHNVLGDCGLPADDPMEVTLTKVE